MFVDTKADKASCIVHLRKSHDVVFYENVPSTNDNAIIGRLILEWFKTSAVEAFWNGSEPHQ